MEIYAHNNALVKASTIYFNEIISRFFHDKTSFEQLYFTSPSKLLAVKPFNYIKSNLISKKN